MAKPQKTSVGPHNVTTITGDYTLDLADADGFIVQRAGGGGDLTVTIPANSAVDFLVGTEINFIAFDSDGGATMLAAGAGVTIVDMGSATYLGNCQARIVQTIPDTWIAYRY